MAEELPTYFGTGIARRIAGWLGFLLDCTVPRMADHVVALTEAAARGLRKRGVRRDRLSVVPPGIRFSPSELATTETGPRPARSYLYAGNLDRYQNLEFLLHVARRVAAEVPGAQLEIATHRDTREIAASIRAAGLGEREVRCLRLGSFLDLRARLWAGRVAVCPRVTSGSLPIKLINYLQHGLAVVAFESCGAGITHLSTGWLAPDKDLGMFARGVTAFLKDPALAEAVGREAQRWAIWEFDPDRAAHRVETIYSDVVPRADRAYPPGQRSPASSTTPLLESHFRPGWSDRGGLFPPEPGAVGKEVPR
jgi:glycosyltransferase involved in cell wall biosynthesis